MGSTCSNCCVISRNGFNQSVWSMLVASRVEKACKSRLCISKRASFLPLSFALHYFKSFVEEVEDEVQKAAAGLHQETV